MLLSSFLKRFSTNFTASGGPRNMNSIYRNFTITSTNAKIVPNNLKGKSKQSQEWLIRQMNDPYVKKAKEQNYRARSAFKLIEIDDKLKILKPGMKVLDCGASPGAWTQVFVERTNSNTTDQEKRVGKVVGVDLLSIDPIPGAILLPNSDFTNESVQQKIIQLIDSDGFLSKGASEKNTTPKFFDVIASDMAPNASGISSLDHSRICTLINSCIRFAHLYAKPGSNFIAKAWDGTDMKTLEMMLRQHYKFVTRVKPKSSREESAEVYLVGQVKLRY